MFSSFIFHHARKKCNKYITHCEKQSNEILIGADAADTVDATVTLPLVIENIFTYIFTYFFAIMNFSNKIIIYSNSMSNSTFLKIVKL